jgi:hypothetical protein
VYVHKWPLRRTAVELAEEAVKEREEEKKELLQQQSLKETYVLVTQEAVHSKRIFLLACIYAVHAIRGKRKL